MPRISLSGLEDLSGDAKDEAERRLARILGRALTAQEKRILEKLGPEAVLANLDAEFWKYEGELLSVAVIGAMTDMAVESANVVLENAPIGVEVGALNEEAARWAAQHTGKLIGGIGETTQRNVANAVQRYLSMPQAEFRDLERMLAYQFGPSRAEGIAVTEVTNAYAAGEGITQRALMREGINTVRVWQTMQDERVCPVCEPLQDTKEPYPGAGFEGGLWGPAAHVRCRCWTILELMEQ